MSHCFFTIQPPPFLTFPIPNITQNWLHVNCPRFVENNEWPPNSRSERTGLSHPGHHAGKVAPADELKVTVQTIWEELPQEHIHKAVAIFTKHCVTASGGHFEHL